MNRANAYCRLHLLVLLMMACICCPTIVAQQQALDDATFDSLMDRLEEATRFNDSKQFLEAYRSITIADQQLTAEASPLNDSDFELLYWPIKKTRAEVAYKLGLHGVMADVVSKMSIELDGHSGIDAARRDGMKADLARIEGNMHFTVLEYAQAEQMLQRALFLKPREMDPLFTAAVRDDLAQLYYAQGDYQQALNQLDTLLSAPAFTAGYRFLATDEERWEIESQRALCMARMGMFDQAYAIIDHIVKRHKGKDQLSYAEALRKQGKIMMLQSASPGQSNPNAVACYRDYLTTMKSYVDRHFIDMSDEEREQFWMAEQPFVTDCYGLEGQAADLLYDVALFSKAILVQMGRSVTPAMPRAERQRIMASMRVKWSDVQSALKADAAAIEFVSYQRGNSGHIGALVITKTSKRPSFVYLASVDSIMSYRLSTGQSVEMVITASRNDSGNDALYNDSCLKSIIWNDDLIRAIGGCSDVYFAADGILHTLAVEYLRPDALAHATMHRLTTTRLLTQSRSQIDTRDMLLCGYVDYENCRDSGIPVDNDAVAYSIMTSPPSRYGRLQATLAEVDSTHFLRSSHSSDKVLLGDSVDEATMRQLMPRYHLIHIAIPGCSPTAIKAGHDLQPPVSDELLSQCCLLMAGAVRNMFQSQFDPSQADGILSAREIAGLDLSRVDMAVLSACLTAPGEVSADGVYGLQRGLKAAGVRSIIVSLWEVNDDATNMLMKSFYGNLEQGMPVQQAFDNAREALRNHELKRFFRGRWSSKRPFDSPHFYNAFILIDGI